MKTNLYDFDNTIYHGDSSVDFFLYNLKKKPYLFFHLFYMLYGFILYKLKLIKGGKFKSIIFSYIRFIKDIDHELEIFWNKNFSKIKDFYLKGNHKKDIIITAGPDFLFAPIKEKLGCFDLIATTTNKKTGKVTGNHCHGREKVRRLHRIYKDIEVIEAYSDSKNDIPMLMLADNAFYVKGNEIIPTKFLKTKKAKHVKKQMIKKGEL